jgi:F0F1-type ATP synthase assembly protein I
MLVARYSGLAIALPACTFVGWVIGTLLDKWLHTTWLYLVGLILGSIAGFVELIRAATSSESKQ